MLIGNRRIGKGGKVYLIAEIGSNHNQDKSLALQMIERAAAAGADAVKFQSISFEHLYQPAHETSEFREWFRQIELDEDWYSDLKKCADYFGVDFISAPTYTKAVDLLEEQNVPAYKIASPQVQGNLDLVRRAAQTGKPLILSLGYSEYSDICRVLNIAYEEGNKNIALLHCVSHYPMEPAAANLRLIHTLESMTGCPVGFSDHSRGDHLAVAAVALGACIVEKHITTDRSLPGPDHHFAMLIEEFAEMARKIREIEVSLGDGVRLALSDETYRLRKNVELNAFSKSKIPAGSPITEKDLEWSRYSGTAVGYDDLKHLLRCHAKTDIEVGAPLTWGMLELDKEIEV